MIESVTIFHGDSEESPSIEIRCVGGVYFCFMPAFKVLAQAKTCLADNRTGNLERENNRIFESVIDAQEAVDD